MGRGPLRFRPLALMAGLSLGIAGPPAAAVPVTLDEAVRLALRHHPALMAARSDVEAAGHAAGSSRGLRWPRLMAEGAVRRTDHQVLVFGDKLTAAEFTADDFALDRLNHPEDNTHLTAALTLEAPLYTSGRIAAGVEEAASAAMAAGGNLRAAEMDLVARVAGAYHDITLAREALRVAESSLEDARRHERVAVARHEEGSALRSDALRAGILRLARERAVTRRRAEAELAVSRLSLLVGLPPGERAEPLDPLGEPAEQTIGLEEWIARGLSARPEIEAAGRQAEAAGARAGIARSALGPEVSGLARYERNAGEIDAGEGSFLLGVGIRWAAFDRARASRIAEADARRDAAVSSVDAVRDAVRLQVEQAWRDEGVARASLSAARQTARDAASAREIVAERYAAGLQPLTDLIDVETQLEAARHDEVAALHALVVSRVRLERAAGSLEVPR